MLQQAKVIESSADFKVGWYSGGSKRLRNHEEWEKELAKYEVTFIKLRTNLYQRVIWRIYQ